MFNIFSSKWVRQAKDMCKQVQKLMNAQRDILQPPAIIALQKALNETQNAIKQRVTQNALRDQMTALEDAANKWLKPYPHSSIRENVEVLLVALSVAMAIRTFFLQPFKIPTGSMQPTLFGVSVDNLKSKTGGPQPPGLPQRLFDGCVMGVFYHYQVAEDDCEIKSIGEVETVAKFINKTTIEVQYKGQKERTPYTFWFTPDERFAERAGIALNQHFRKGEQIVNFKETAGDHVFVDRLTYNFRPPKRGEIIVFETKGTGIRDQNQFYIKRLVALGGEKVQIGDDRHLIIDGKRLDASTPHFENVYSFDPALPPRKDNYYSGHVNQAVVEQYKLRDENGNRLFLAPNFPDQNREYPMPPNHYMVMGDNTLNSYDSRAWEIFPART